MIRAALPYDELLPERSYAVRTVLEHYLGLPCEIGPGLAGRTTLTVEGSESSLEVADCFGTALPKVLPSVELPLERLPQPPRVLSCFMPLLFARGQGDAVTRTGETRIELGFDVFMGTFFLLTRMEERGSISRDTHGRFPFSGSFAERAGLLERPLVDEYAEVLWACISSLWPALQRTPRRPRVLLSHDVDLALHGGFGPDEPLLGWALRTSWKSRRPDQTICEALRHAIRRWRRYAGDAYNTYDRLMHLAERHGIRTSFYFMAGRTVPERDGNYDIRHPWIRRVLRHIHGRGHEIGFHPSYDTIEAPQVLAGEFATLRAVCAEEGICQDSWGGRQHYLRWNPVGSWRAWESAGLAYDGTLGFAERPGFRCGTCREFPVFDLVERRPLSLMERPLVAMDTTLFAPQYLGLAPDQPAAFDHLRRLWDICKFYGGDFSLLWHNSSLVHPASEALIEAVLAS